MIRPITTSSLKDFTKKNKIEFIEPDYDGIAKVLNEFEKLYKVCENKELLDKCLERFLSPFTIIKD